MPSSESRAVSKLSEMDEKGARAYLCPLFPTYGGSFGAASGLPALGTGLCFMGFRLLIRQGESKSKELVFDQIFDASALAGVLEVLPADLRLQVERQLAQLKAVRPPLMLGDGKSLPFTKTRIMGVVNVTPDSFSDGGETLDSGEAIRTARAVAAHGADIIDIGGESTRPGADPVWEGDEWLRVAPVFEGLADDDFILSADTRRASVMEKACALGAHIINDVSALTYDEAALQTASAAGVPVILMHAQGTPDMMQDAPDYDHVLLDVYDYLEARIEACVAAGIGQDRLLIDPGLGFGKRVIEDNLALMRGLALFHTLGLPVLVGASRKRFVGVLTDVADARERVIGSVMAAVEAARMGVQIVRVHDVRETREALKFMQGLADSSLMDLPASCV